MKLLYLVNLFIVCSSAFTIQPSNSLMLKSNINICRCHSLPSSYNFYKNYQSFKKPTINNFLKKNNDEDNIQILTINLIYNLILYAYIYYLIISKQH